jgi:hypothetical protein
MEPSSSIINDDLVPGSDSVPASYEQLAVQLKQQDEEIRLLKVQLQALRLNHGYEHNVWDEAMENSHNEAADWLYRSERLVNMPYLSSHYVLYIITCYICSWMTKCGFLRPSFHRHHDRSFYHRDGQTSEKSLVQSHAPATDDPHGPAHGDNSSTISPSPKRSFRFKKSFTHSNSHGNHSPDPRHAFSDMSSHEVQSHALISASPFKSGRRASDPTAYRPTTLFAEQQGDESAPSLDWPSPLSSYAQPSPAPSSQAVARDWVDVDHTIVAEDSFDLEALVESWSSEAREAVLAERAERTVSDRGEQGTGSWDDIGLDGDESDSDDEPTILCKLPGEVGFRELSAKDMYLIVVQDLMALRTELSYEKQ